MSIERFEDLVLKGHEVTVLTSGEAKFPGIEQMKGITIFRSPIIHNSRVGRGFRRVIFPLWANLMVRKNNPDVVHLSSAGGVEPITFNFGLTLLNWGAHKIGARTVWVHSLADSENESFSIRGSKKRLRQIFLKDIDFIVSVSPALDQGVARIFPQKAVLIVNGVHNDIYKPLPTIERTIIRTRQGISDKDVVFIFLGSLSRRKGFDILAHAFADLSPKFPNWRLWVIGPQTVRENQNLDPAEVALVCAPLKNLQDRVHFWGRMDDRQIIADLLASSDVFVFPTLREGMPLSPVEAMASGIPVIISLLPGVTDIIVSEGQTGLFVKPGDVNSLKVAMQTLGENPELRRLMGIAAVQRVCDFFAWQPFLDKWEKLYLGKI